jgi:fumarate reductase flavoprotein subunit
VRPWRSAELGLRTSALETGTDDGYLCSSRWAGGIFHVSCHDVKLPGRAACRNQPPDQETDQQSAAAIAADAGRTVDLLARQGARFSQDSPIGWHRFTLAPQRLPVAGQDWQARGPDRLLGELRRRLEAARTGSSKPRGSNGCSATARSGRCIRRLRISASTTWAFTSWASTPPEVLPSLKPA